MNKIKYNSINGDEIDNIFNDYLKRTTDDELSVMENHEIADFVVTHHRKAVSGNKFYIVDEILDFRDYLYRAIKICKSLLKPAILAPVGAIFVFIISYYIFQTSNSLKDTATSQKNQDEKLAVSKQIETESSNENNQLFEKSVLVTLDKMPLRLSSYSYNREKSHTEISNQELINEAMRIMKAEFEKNNLKVSHKTNNEIVSNWIYSSDNKNIEASRLVIKFTNNANESISMHEEKKSVTINNDIRIERKVDYLKLIRNFKKKYYKFVESEMK